MENTGLPAKKVCARRKFGKEDGLRILQLQEKLSWSAASQSAII